MSSLEFGIVCSISAIAFSVILLKVLGGSYKDNDL